MHSSVGILEVLFQSMIYGLTFSTISVIWIGGFDIIQVFVLRFFLYNKEYIPSINLRDFLDYASKCSFLVRRGNEYRFDHDEIRDHLSKNIQKKNQTNFFQEKWNFTAKRFILPLLIFFLVFVGILGTPLRDDIGRFLFANHPEIEGYEKYSFRIGDNIRGQSGVIPDSILVLKGDVIMIKAGG